MKLKVPFTHLTTLFYIFDKISVLAGPTSDARTTDPAEFDAAGGAGCAKLDYKIRLSFTSIFRSFKLFRTILAVAKFSFYI